MRCTTLKSREKTKAQFIDLIKIPRSKGRISGKSQGMRPLLFGKKLIFMIKFPLFI